MVFDQHDWISAGKGLPETTENQLCNTTNTVKLSSTATTDDQCNSASKKELQALVSAKSRAVPKHWT